MKIALAVFLIIFSVLWLIGITLFYSDNFMTYNHAILYSIVCFLIILLAIYLIYSHIKFKK